MNDTLQLIPIDVFKQYLSSFLDDESVIVLSMSSKCYSNLLIHEKSQFTINLWKTCCKNRWKYVNFDTISDTQEDGDNQWLDAYRRHRVLDQENENLLKAIQNCSLKDLQKNEALFSSVVSRGQDIVDIFLNCRDSLQWKSKDMPTIIEKSLFRYCICEIFRSESAEDMPLESGTIWIAQYFSSNIVNVANASLVSLRNSSFQRRIEKELDDMARALVSRLQKRHSIFNSNVDVPSSQSFPLLNILEEMKYFFDKNHEDRQNAEHSQGSAFQGNVEDYYSYKNSMIQTVLSERKGIPITLGIVYAAIVRRATNVHIRAVNLPGHFMLSVEEVSGSHQDDILFVDVFHGGKILTQREVEDMITSGYNIRWDQSFVSPVPNLSVWKRVAFNLTNCHDLPNEVREQVHSLIIMGFNHNRLRDLLGNDRLLYLIPEYMNNEDVF